jgi:YggT family protein
MNSDFLIQFVEILSATLQILIIARVLMSWVVPNPTGPIGRFLMEMTDPVLKPFQKIIPPMAGIDFSPILALVIIQVLSTLTVNAL